MSGVGGAGSVAVYWTILATALLALVAVGQLAVGQQRRGPVKVSPARAPVARPTWSDAGGALRLFFRGATVPTAWKVALVVGTLLSLVNQGTVVVSGHATWATWLRIGVNYLVPFVVASIGFLSACRAAPVESR